MLVLEVLVEGGAGGARLLDHVGDRGLLVSLAADHADHCREDQFTPRFRCHRPIPGWWRTPEYLHHSGMVYVSVYLLVSAHLPGCRRWADIGDQRGKKHVRKQTRTDTPRVPRPVRRRSARRPRRSPSARCSPAGCDRPGRSRGPPRRAASAAAAPPGSDAARRARRRRRRPAPGGRSPAPRRAPRAARPGPPGRAAASAPRPRRRSLTRRTRASAIAVVGGEEAGFLVVEHRVEGGARDAGLAGQVGDRGRAIALLGDDADGRLEQPLALGAGDHLGWQPVAAARRAPALAFRDPPPAPRALSRPLAAISFSASRDWRSASSWPR